MNFSDINKPAFISLLSGGFDSPVASSLMVSRGFHPIFLTFSTSSKSSDPLKSKIITIIRKISSNLEHDVKLYFIEFENFLSNVKSVCQRKLTCILCKRTMIKIAKIIGKNEKTRFIVTGDILGEQASQTLDNIYSYNSLLDDFVIIRPLIGFNKNEVVKLNRNMGFYQICSQKISECRFYPKYPETHAKVEEIERAHLKIKNFNLLELVNNAEIIKI